MKINFIKYAGAMLAAIMLLTVTDNVSAADKSSTTATTTSGSIGMTPSGSIISSASLIQIVVPYTVPANSGAVMKLLQNGRVVATVSIPGSVTANSIAFTLDLSGVTGSTTLQAQLSYNTTTTTTTGKTTKTTTTSTLLSPTLTVNRQTNGGHR